MCCYMSIRIIPEIHIKIIAPFTGYIPVQEMQMQ